MRPADEVTVAYYMQEACGELALALHRRTGMPLAILWDNETLDDWGRGEEPTPAHVFVTDPGTGEALDIKGRRSIAQLKEDFFDLEEPEIDDQVTEAELLDLMGDDRPLYESTSEGQRQACETIALLDLG